MSHYIIEHPTRGTYVEYDEHKVANATFSVSGLRSEARMFTSMAEARAVRSTISPAVRIKCMIRRQPEGEDYDWLPMCLDCDGTGKDPADADTCPTCNGAGIDHEGRSLVI
jgi:DnaJ-class molecular chaperone